MTKRAVQTVQSVSASKGAGYAALLLLAAYLGIVLVRGNLPKFGQAFYADFVGTDTKPAFWRWGAALVILWSLSESDTWGGYFTPVFYATIVAMLILNAETQPDAWNNLRSGVETFFGYGSKTATDGFGLKPASPATGG